MRSEPGDQRTVALAGWAIARGRTEPAVAVFALVLLAISADYLLAPVLNTVAPLVASALLLLLLLRGKRRPAEAVALAAASTLVRWRLALFLLLHLAGLGLVWRLPGPAPAIPGNSPHDVALAAAKYLVLLPTFVLLPLSGWRRFDRLYRAEWMVAVIALLTFFPYRIFNTLWPWYSAAMGRVVYTLASPFVSGLQYVSGGSPVLVGPGLDVVVSFACSGLEGIKLLQVVFIVILILDWPALAPRRALQAYCAGFTLMLAANTLRIVLLVVLGNKLSPALALRYHLIAGWIFFALVIGVGLLAGHNWLFREPGAPRRQLQPDTLG